MWRRTRTQPPGVGIAVRLREARLRVLVTAMREPPRRAALVDDETWLELFGLEDELAIAGAFLARPGSVGEYRTQLKRLAPTRPLAASLRRLPRAHERWEQDLSLLRMARCADQVRRLAEEVLRRKQRETARSLGLAVGVGVVDVLGAEASVRDTNCRHTRTRCPHEEQDRAPPCSDHL